MDKQNNPNKPNPEISSEMVKLREVLFGQQFRDHEKRYQRLEEKIKKEFDNLRNEINLRINALEEVERVTIKDIEDFKKSTISTENDLRQFSLSSSKELTNELNRIQKELTEELETDFGVLDSEKVNKSALATMLGEIIMQLNSGKEKSH